jgi:N-acetylglucosaminyldiphosphoundecaprenol N-acetyl-beta-D-mannosaminyltransferase
MAKQEKFIADNLPRLKVGIALGVGGAFDVWAGRLRRAPKIFRDLKIEWLFRLLQQPERFKRIISLCFFVWLILRNKNS